MAQFMLLAHRDLGGHAMLCWLRKPPSSEGPPQLVWLVAAVNLTDDLRSCDPAAARALLDDMRGVAAQRDEAPLWKEWAQAAFNLTLELRSSDPAAARALLAELRLRQKFYTGSG
jgi:hypothetical protein